MYLFIQNLLEPGQGLFSGRFFFLAWVSTIIVSITLHELAHGWMAIRCGDDTPLRMDRMTGNPLVHMGPFSLVALFLVGIAWGQMPIEPGRLRGKYAEAKVAFAGPAVNLILCLVCMIALAVSMVFLQGFHDDGSRTANLQQFLLYAGSANVMLFVFNLMPVPPLDGSHILANFNRGYARFISDPSKQGLFMLMFIGVFILSSNILVPVQRAYVQLTAHLYSLFTLIG